MHIKCLHSHRKLNCLMVFPFSEIKFKWGTVQRKNIIFLNFLFISNTFYCLYIFFIFSFIRKRTLDMYFPVHIYIFLLKGRKMHCEKKSYWRIKVKNLNVMKRCDIKRYINRCFHLFVGDQKMPYSIDYVIIYQNTFRM